MLARATRWPLLAVLVAAFSMAQAAPAQAHMLKCKTGGKLTQSKHRCHHRQHHHAVTALRWIDRHPKLTTANKKSAVRKLAWQSLRGHRWLRDAMQRRITTWDYSTGIGPWIAKQIRVATLIGRAASVDPWPNCSDPIWDGAASWEDTVKCENRRIYELHGFPRAWLDSPGFFRCGLQFHPNWERKYGLLCPR